MASDAPDVIKELLKDLVDELAREEEAEEKKRLWFQKWDLLPRLETNLPEFGQRCTAEWLVSADLNDVRQRMLTLLPRRMHLQLNGDALRECYAPFFCVHWWLGMPYAQFLSILGEDFGKTLVWGVGKMFFTEHQRLMVWSATIATLPVASGFG